MRKIKRFILYWIHNSVLIYFASQIFPGKFVLGNAKLSFVGAIVLSGLFVTVFFEVGKIMLSKVKKVKIEGVKKHLYYLLVNFAGLWIAARMAPVLGFGVVRFTWLLGLAVILNCVQKGISLGFEQK